MSEGGALAEEAWGMPKREQRLDGGAQLTPRWPSPALPQSPSTKAMWLSSHPPSPGAPLPAPSVSSLCGSSPAISQERGRKDRQGESPKRS